VVGLDDEAQEGLLNEDGAIEAGAGRFCVEPFLWVDGELVTWADVKAEQFLEGGSLPIPSVRWHTRDLALTVTAFGAGSQGSSSVAARYLLENRGRRQVAGTLFLALRPFQVNPPSQTLNQPGGTTPLREMAAEGDTVRVDGEPGVVTLTRAAGFGAVVFDRGDIVDDYLRRGRLPDPIRVEDPFQAASGALAYPFDLPSGSQQTVEILIPLPADPPAPGIEDAAGSPGSLAERLARCRDGWEGKMGRVAFRYPPPAAPALESLEAQLAYILINRAGPAIQPGTRSYARSWIRDGALTSSALLRLGHPEPVRAFIEWYGPHQYPNGKIPCVVDSRGADPVPEHDSSGEFIFLIAEYYRYTGDRALAERMWPRIAAAVGYLDSLRQERRTPEYRSPDKAEFFGILPPSISHEGYSAKPMHSYWDDLFALRGFKDAEFLARELEFDVERARIAKIRSEFGRDLGASVEAAMRRHEIDYVPGCADLGDFDPTSTTIALAPVAATDVLPRGALERTFERYYGFFRGRRGGASWEAFTPYEIRNIGAFVHLGWRERAEELLDYFLSHQRPQGWRQWAEVVWRDPREPRFIGDMPHTWVGSDYIRSVLDMFAYVRESDQALVVGAGVPASWLRSEGGVSVRGLRTPYGALDLTMISRGEAVEVRIEGNLQVPAGGILIDPPLAGPVREVEMNGRHFEPGAAGEVLVREVPAVIILHP
jgi:hypothetical protein